MGLDHSVSEIFRMLLGFFLACCLLSVVVFSYQLQTLNTFRQQVNYRIERKGGLTTEAVKEINQYSKEYFHGWYTVDSNQIGNKVIFGENVDYKIIGTYPIAFLPLPDLNVEVPGQASSQVR
ncbi:hypothetical protein [Enterococcus casseliflavus]|uniref:hypothetical protein n=1 Tax=Enterococcus casseliflavus TaxID=37734 RepID=UPI001157F931|nr:hypothetical protein [Enterococcus casseliflavus]